MLGSRFDLSETLNEIASRSDEATSAATSAATAEANQITAIRNEASCLELEREMAAVAKTLHVERTRVMFRCPVCDDDMRVSDELDLSEFGGLEVKLHRLKCDTCGMLTGRVYHPSIGYHSHLVR